MTSLKNLEKYAKSRYSGYKKIAHYEDLNLLICRANIYKVDECRGLFYGESEENNKKELERYNIIYIDNLVKKEDFNRILIHELMHFVCSEMGFALDNLDLEEAVCHTLDRIFHRVTKTLILNKS